MVAVILLNWRNAPDTIAAVESLLKTSPGLNFRVVVCDNASNDGSAQSFLTWARNHTDSAADFFISASTDISTLQAAFEKQVVWVNTGSNLGFAGGNNVGVRIAQRVGHFEYFWFLNNDCLVTPVTMGALVSMMERDSAIGICGARLRYIVPDDRIQAYGGARHNRWSGRARYIGHWAAPDEPHSRDEVERSMSYVCGASMFVRREVIETVGLMAEDYFLFFEELDWALRTKATFKLGYCPEAVVYHKEGATIGSSSDTKRTSWLSDFYLFRNRLKFTARFYPYALPSVWFVMLLQALRRGLRGQRDRMWLILQIMFGRKAP